MATEIALGLNAERTLGREEHSWYVRQFKSTMTISKISCAKNLCKWNLLFKKLFSQQFLGLGKQVCVDQSLYETIHYSAEGYSWRRIRSNFFNVRKTNPWQNLFAINNLWQMLSQLRARAQYSCGRDLRVIWNYRNQFLWSDQLLSIK